MTFGRHVQKYVEDIRVGTRRVAGVFLDGRRIWPDGEGLVTGVGLDLEPVSVGEDAAYWRHALGVLFGGVDYVVPATHSFILGQVELGGRTYTFGVDETQHPGREREVAGYDDGEVTLAGAQIPPDKLHIGSLVVVRAVVPEHYTQEASAARGEAVDELWEAPWLPGSGLEVSASVGSVFIQGNISGSLKGYPGGEDYITFSRSFSRDRNFTLYPADGFTAPDGDTGMLLGVNPDSLTTLRKARVKFPRFGREFVFRVVSVTYHA